MMDTSPSPSSIRKIPPLEDFLNSISPENPVGPSLRYEPVYDAIRLARQEDDPRLSMGIWKTELKRASWNQVEALCADALTTKSKDLQMGGWLTEAWISLDGIEGYMRGVQLLLSLIEAFWDAIHPQPDDDGDMEHRLMIFEWMDKAFSSRLLLVPLTQPKFDQAGRGLGFFKSAQYNDASQKRLEKATRHPVANADPSKTMGTLEDFQRSLDQTPDDYLSQRLQKIGNAVQATQTLKETLSSLLGDSSPSFSQILGTLKEMERIPRTALQARVPLLSGEEPAPETISPHAQSMETRAPGPDEAPSGKLTPGTRHDAYRHLETIAVFLEQTDPHSLAPRILRQLIRWENKNIVEILEEIAKTPQEYDILAKILGVSQKG